MKRSILALLVGVGLSLLLCSVAFAATLTATLPAGSMSAKVSKVTAVAPWDGSTDVWGTAGPLPGSIAFGTLTELLSDGTGGIPAGSPLGIFGPADKGYYAIDIGFGSGGGMPANPPNVLIVYGGDAELRQRVVTIYKQMVFGAAEPTGEKLYMSDAVPTFVGLDASYQGGKWVRIYLGINTNWDTGLDPTGTHVFNYAAPAGAYSATMTITIS